MIKETNVRITVTLDEETLHKLYMLCGFYEKSKTKMVSHLISSEYEKKYRR